MGANLFLFRTEPRRIPSPWEQIYFFLEQSPEEFLPHGSNLFPFRTEPRRIPSPWEQIYFFLEQSP